MSDVEKIKSSLSVSDLIGFDGTGSHPVHGSTTKSNIHVDSANNRWYCFRHSAGGGPLEWIAVQDFNAPCNDAIDYVRNNFVAVMKNAGKITGIEFKDMRTPEIIDIQSVFNIAQKYYTEQLDKHPEIQKIITDLWGFDKEQTKKLGIGFAPNNYKLPITDKTAKTTEYNAKKIMLKTGLFYENLRPHISGRITLPYIIDGLPKYFIGRRIEGITKDKMGKYIKLLKYDKEKRSYVARRLKEPLLKSFSKYDKNEYVVITEGIADYYSLLLWNIPAMTPVTTSFKDNHIKRMKFYLKNKQVYICNDNESSGAGTEGAFRILKSISHAKIVELPRKDDEKKVDVNDYFREHDKQDFEKLLEAAVPGYYHLSQKHLIDVDIDELDRNQIIQLAASFIITNVAKTHPMYIVEAKLSDKNDNIIYYSNGRYKHDIKDQWLRRKISQYMSMNTLEREDIKKTHINDVVERVKFHLIRKKIIDIDNLPRFNIENNKTLLINCKNGIVKVDKLNDYKIKLIPHSAKYMFRSRVNVEFNPNFNFDDYHTNGIYPSTVADIVSRAGDINDDELKYWMMEMAYLFTPTAFLQHMPHIVGIGNTGKSTIIIPIEQMFEKMSDISLSLLVDNDYGTGSLYNIDLLSINEIDKNPNKGLEILKALGTMETLTLNPKYVSMIDNYKIKNKTIMRSNHYLDLKDSSEKRRFFLFRAHTKFDKAKIDLEREHKLVADKDNIFNYIIRYLPELYKNRLELKTMTTDRYDKHFKLYGDPLRTHFKLHMVHKESDDFNYTTDEMRQYFNKWAVDVGFDEIKSVRVFGKLIMKLAEEGIEPFFDVSQQTRMRVGNGRKMGWKQFDYIPSFARRYINNDSDKPIIEELDLPDDKGKENKKYDLNKYFE